VLLPTPPASPAGTSQVSSFLSVNYFLLIEKVGVDILVSLSVGANIKTLLWRVIILTAPFTTPQNIAKLINFPLGISLTWHTPK